MIRDENLKNLKNLKNKEKLKVIDKKNINKKYLNILNIDDVMLKDLVFLKPFKKFDSIKEFKLTLDEYISLIENTSFIKSDIEKGIDIEFENLFSNKDLFLKRHINSNDKEFHFIKSYIFVYIVLLLMSFFICFYIFIKNLFKKLIREYKIHMISGADLKGIFIRNSCFILSLILINFILIMFLNKFKLDTIFFINLFSNIFYFLSLEIIVLIIILKTDLSFVGEDCA